MVAGLSGIFGGNVRVFNGTNDVNKCFSPEC